MTLSSSSFHHAPRPGVGAEVWIEDLVGGPWETVVTGHQGELVRVAAPRLGHQRVSLPLDESFTLTYRDREVPCEAPAVLVTHALGRDGGDYLVKLVAPPVRLQRRGSVRVPIRLIVRAAAKDTRAEVDASATIAGLTENLSADGALVRLDAPLHIGDVIEIAVQCGGVGGTVQATADVVRCDRQEGGSRPWRAALAFRDLDRADQERLVRHLFERQRELRRAEVEAG